MKCIPRAILTGWARPLHTGLSDDPDVLTAALAPAAGKRYICVSCHGAGEAALCLAAGGADTVVIADIGDAAMLQRMMILKIAAAQALDRADYLALMGLWPAGRKHRQTIISCVFTALSDTDRSFWLRRQSWFSPGLFFACRQTFFMQLALILIRMLTPAQSLHNMLRSDSAEDRVEIFRRYVCRLWLLNAISFLGKHINLFYPQDEWNNSDYPKELNRNPMPYFTHLIKKGIAENPLFAHYFLPSEGRLPERLLPPHVRRGMYKNLQTVKNRLQVLIAQPGTLPELPTHASGFDGAYFSNCIDYLGPNDRETLLRRVSSALRPNAPFLIYSNEAYSKVPPGLGLQLDSDASARLAFCDRACIYSRIELYRVTGQ